MCWQLRTSAVFLFLAIVLFLNVRGGTAAEPDPMGDGRCGSQAEVDAFLADLAARPEAEQRRQLEALIAQLPPDSVGGDPARARRLLLAALDRDGKAVYRVNWAAWPEKSRPIALDALTTLSYCDR